MIFAKINYNNLSLTELFSRLSRELRGIVIATPPFAFGSNDKRNGQSVWSSVADAEEEVAHGYQRSRENNRILESGTSVVPLHNMRLGVRRRRALRLFLYERGAVSGAQEQIPTRMN